MDVFWDFGLCGFGFNFVALTGRRAIEAPWIGLTFEGQFSTTPMHYTIGIGGLDSIFELHA